MIDSGVIYFYSYVSLLFFPVAEKKKKKGNLWSPLNLSCPCNLLYSQCLVLSSVAFLSILTAEQLCMALCCRSYCESKYTSHWNN